MLGTPETEWQASFLLPSYFQRHDRKTQPDASTAGGFDMPPVGRHSQENVPDEGMHGSTGNG